MVFNVVSRFLPLIPEFSNTWQWLFNELRASQILQISSMIPCLGIQVQYRSLTDTRWQHWPTLTEWQCCTVRHSRTIDSVIVINLALKIISDCTWFVYKDSFACSCLSSLLFQWTNSKFNRDNENMRASLSKKCRSGPISETCYWGVMARSQRQ